MSKKELLLKLLDETEYLPVPALEYYLENKPSVVERGYAGIRQDILDINEEQISHEDMYEFIARMYLSHLNVLEYVKNDLENTWLYNEWTIDGPLSIKDTISILLHEDDSTFHEEAIEGWLEPYKDELNTVFNSTHWSDSIWYRAATMMTDLYLNNLDRAVFYHFANEVKNFNEEHDNRYKYLYVIWTNQRVIAKRYCVMYFSDEPDREKYADLLYDKYGYQDIVDMIEIDKIDTNETYSKLDTDDMWNFVLWNYNALPDYIDHFVVETKESLLDVKNKNNKNATLPEP